ncbi:MAG: hypothetical protein KC502_19205 [Myxococcales bacterium]|nr:hypothetical protein [Myxococcales bacterium]
MPDRTLRLLLPLVLISGTLIGPGQLWAQCAVCGNPAVAFGDNDIARTFLADAPKRLRWTASLNYVGQRYADIYSGSQRLKQAEKSAIMFTPDWQLDTHQMAAFLGLELKSGSQISLVLPIAVARSQRISDLEDADGKDSEGHPIATSTDKGMADVELRLRQRLSPLTGRLPLGIRDVILSAGLAAPTGHFIAKDPNGAEPDGYASLGRGTWWALGDLEVIGRISPRLGWQAGSSLRKPLTTITNAGFLFRWGTEIRSFGTAVVRVLPDRFHASVGAEWLWRSSGEERIFEGLPIDDFPNGGGRWLTAVVALQARIVGGISVHSAIRMPLWRRVRGQQPVPGFGATLGVGWQG